MSERGREKEQLFALPLTVVLINLPIVCLADTPQWFAHVLQSRHWRALLFAVLLRLLMMRQSTAAVFCPMIVCKLSSSQLFIH